MQDLKKVFEGTLELEETNKDVRYRPGDELIVDQEGKDVNVTVIEVEKKTGKVRVKSSDGTDLGWYEPSAVKSK